jgi:hypothetical protein
MKRVLDGHRARQADLAAIHIARKALSWSEDEYRDIMATVCGGIRSAGELDHAGRKRLLAHMQACVLANGRPAAHASRRTALTPEEKKVWALWMNLADAGLVQARTMKAIDTWVARQTGGVSTFRFCNPKQRALVIESLKRWLASREEPQA